MEGAVRGILDSTLYCVLGTVAPENKPWAIPIRFAFDEAYIYFRSSSDSVHSSNIASNPHVSVTIFDTTQEIKGSLYIHSQAKKLEGDEEKNAITIFNERFSNPPDQWNNTVYFKVAIGEIDAKKSIERMFYFQERIA